MSQNIFYQRYLGDKRIKFGILKKVYSVALASIAIIFILTSVAGAAPYAYISNQALRHSLWVR